MNAIIGLDNPPFLNRLDDVISNQSYKKVVAAYPRGHGKSTHLSVGYPLWRIAQDHNLRFLLTSKTTSIAQAFMRGILNHIESNEKYQAFARYCDPKHIGVIPKMGKVGGKEERWSSTAITVDRDDLMLKDPTIQAIGLFGSIVSKRADEIIADDVVDQKNSDTEEQREKIKDWFDTTLLPILTDDKSGRVIYLGNTWHMNDLVAKLLTDPGWDFRERLQSIIHEPTNFELWQEWAKIRLDEQIDPLERMASAEVFYQSHRVEMEDGVEVMWPERMPYKKLYLLRLSNSYSFARMYMCNPALRPDQRFQESWLSKAKEKGKNLKLQVAPREGFTMDMTTVGVDLAISLKDSADDSVLLSLDRVKYGDDVIKPGDFVLRNIERGKFTPKDVRTKIKTCNDNMHPQGIRVESVAYQESIVRDLWDEGHVNVRGHKTGGEKNDIEIGINSLSVLLENEKLILPHDSSDPRTVELVDRLIDEMRSYPDGHTGDSLMALWFAFLEARDLRGKKFIIPDTEYVAPIKVNGEITQDTALKIDLQTIKESEEKRQSGRGKFIF